jgi:hypothetical protein
MIDIEAIVNLVDQYAKYGWILRRILLSKGSFADLSNSVIAQFPDAEFVPHEIDALWFSRKNKDSETWELRRLGSPPFALVEVIDDILSADEREAKLSSLELEMAKPRPSAPEH